MTTEEIIQILNNKINNLNEQKNLAYMNGDLAAYSRIEIELAETQKLLEDSELLK